MAALYRLPNGLFVCANAIHAERPIASAFWAINSSTSSAQPNAAALAEQGHLTRGDKPFAASQVQRMFGR